MIDSEINTPWTRNVAEVQSRVFRPTASVLLGSGSRKRQRQPRFEFLQGKTNTSLPVRKEKKPD